MRRRNVTLIEMMIVIVLIGLIGSVVAYNMRGSLDEGKAFKTRQGGAQLYNILMLEIAKGKDPEEAVHAWRDLIDGSSLVRNAKEIRRDGWGQEYSVDWDGSDLHVTSASYLTYLEKKGLSSEEGLLR